MKPTILIMVALCGVLILAGCATQPNNNPNSGNQTPHPNNDNCFPLYSQLTNPSVGCCDQGIAMLVGNSKIYCVKTTEVVECRNVGTESEGWYALTYSYCADGKSYCGNPILHLLFYAKCGEGDQSPNTPPVLNPDTCEIAGGEWNACGSKCAIMNQGKTGIDCPQVCDPICVCGGIKGLKCPQGWSCKMPSNVADAWGYCE